MPRKTQRRPECVGVTSTHHQHIDYPLHVRGALGISISAEVSSSIARRVKKKLMPTARTSDFVNRLSIRPPGSLGSSCGHYNNGGSAHACCHVPVGVVVRSVLALRLNSFGNIQSPFPCWRSLAQ